MSRNNSIKNRFGLRLRQLIESMNLRQKEAAKLIGITEGLLSAYIRGKTKPSFYVIIKISETFKVTTDYLLTGKEESDTMQISIRIERKLDELIRRWDSHFKDGDNE